MCFEKFRSISLHSGVSGMCQEIAILEASEG